MKISKSFWQTHKELPRDAEIPSHGLMVRAGLIQKSASGIYSYLPMGLRAIQKVEQIYREELNKTGALEITLPVVTSGELWKKSGRWEQMGAEMVKFSDRHKKDFCLSPTNEEAMVEVFSKIVRSYKQLPVNLYQINTKFRDEIRPRYGVMRGREFTMKDAYSFHENQKCLDQTYRDMYDCYDRIFTRIGLNFIVVQADAGNMGDTNCENHEFQVLAKFGEDRIIHCPDSGYAANKETAETRPAFLDLNKTDLALKEVDTPDKSTISAVGKYLKIPPCQCLKSLVYTAITANEESAVLILLLGDDELNLVKLKKLLKCNHVKPCSNEELEELALPKGYIGPYGLKGRLKIIYDKAVDLQASYTVGALKKDKHLQNFIPKRDDTGYSIADLRLARAGDIAPNGKAVTVKEVRGIEVGHIFQLGDKYTKALNVGIPNKNGSLFYPLMGCYGTGSTRTVAAAIEQSHDKKGIIWHPSIAPYQIHFVEITNTLKNLAEEIYCELSDSFEVLYDDRDKLGVGFKLGDAELLGLPLTVIFGERDYKKTSTLEVRVRRTGEKINLKREQLSAKLKELIERPY